MSAFDLAVSSQQYLPNNLSDFQPGMMPVQTLDLFFAAKTKLDGLDKPYMEEIMRVMHALTAVRAMLMGGLSSGMRNDAPDAAVAMRQRWRLGEVRAEEYFFVLLSRFINALTSVLEGQVRVCVCYLCV